MIIGPKNYISMNLEIDFQRGHSVMRVAGMSPKFDIPAVKESAKMTMK